MNNLQNKVEACYKNLNDANQRILKRTLEIIVEYKNKLDSDPENENLKESLETCYKIVKILDIENNKSGMDEIAFEIGKVSGKVLKGVLIGLIAL